MKTLMHLLLRTTILALQECWHLARKWPKCLGQVGVAGRREAIGLGGAVVRRPQEVIPMDV